MVVSSTIQAYGAHFTVSQSGSSGPGSLAAVITQANSTSGENTIEFAVTNAIAVTKSLPAITNNLSIIGRTDIRTVVSGAGSSALFTFGPETVGALANLALVSASSTNGGAAIRNSGKLIVRDCAIANNKSDGYGGAIRNDGEMAIVSSTIASNQTARGVGGAVYNAGTLSITACSLFGNSAYGGDGAAANDFGGGGGGGAGLGGGIFAARGAITCTNSTIAANSALGGKGGSGSGYSRGSIAAALRW
ncbi:MAG TPA: hypothetical protein VK633_09665 [Verrucomicrobiae bacterium]|nr:hypothetical protein [Verrucomicrobiae bacterium]